MKAEQAKQIADQALTDLATALEQSRSDTLTAYLDAMSRFHSYSFGNIMLIAAQRPDATHVAGFNAWKKLGRFVQKGEKGIVIIAPMRIKPKGDAEPAEDDEDRTILRFRAVHVFDISQTDGDPLPEFARVDGDPGSATERIRAMISTHGIKLEITNDLGSADGASYGGLIKIRPGLSPAEEFSVLVHEFAHELLHRGERRQQLSKTVRETEAEAVAYVVSQAVGLETGSAAADYIQLYAGDAETLAESLDHIQATAAMIIDGVLSKQA